MYLEDAQRALWGISAVKPTTLLTLQIQMQQKNVNQNHLNARKVFERFSSHVYQFSINDFNLKYVLSPSYQLYKGIVFVDN